MVAVQVICARIGRVTGNRIMLPQLRGALNEVVAEGLSKSIYQYGGCYVPRFIAGTNTLSFHSFGTKEQLATLAKKT